MIFDGVLVPGVDDYYGPNSKDAVVTALLESLQQSHPATRVLESRSVLAGEHYAIRLRLRTEPSSVISDMVIASRNDEQLWFQCEHDPEKFSDPKKRKLVEREIDSMLSSFVVNSTGVQPPELQVKSANQVRAFDQTESELRYKISTGIIPPIGIKNVALNADGLFLLKGKKMYGWDVQGDLESDFHWWLESEITDTADFRFVLSNKTESEVHGILFEMSNSDCVHNLHNGPNWLIEFEKPIRPKTRYYFTTTLPVAAGLVRGSDTCESMLAVW